MDLADKGEPEGTADISKAKVSTSVSGPTDKKSTSVGAVVKQSNVKKWFVIAIAVAMVGAMAAIPLWNKFFKSSGPGIGFVNGNGRIEATELDVAAKLAGRIEEILVAEGEFVELGQTLVRMNIASRFVAARFLGSSAPTVVAKQPR